MTLADNSSPTTSPSATQMGSFTSNAAMAQPAPQIIPQPPKLVTKSVLYKPDPVSIDHKIAPDPALTLWQSFQKLTALWQDQHDDLDVVTTLADNDNVVGLPSEARKLWSEMTKSLGMQPKSEAELLALLEKIKVDQKAFEERLKALEAQMNAAYWVRVIDEEPQPDLIVMQDMLPNMFDMPEATIPERPDITDAMTLSEPQLASPTILDDFKQQITDVADTDLAVDKPVLEQTAIIPEDNQPQANQPLKGRVVDFKLNAFDTATEADDSEPVQTTVALKVTRPTLTPAYGIAA